MSWLARLLGRAPAAPAEPAATTAVVVPEDIAERLTAGGIPLAAAVEQALRDHLAHVEQAAQQGNGDKPFWLAREEEAGDLEQCLRDRIAQRRAGEGEAER
jgi:hypothetical protein